jgi:hypothetical protein
MRQKVKKQKMRKQRKTQKTKRPQKRQRQKSFAPRNVKDFFSRSEQFQDTWNRVLHAISRMRADGFSLTRAAREYGLDRQTVLTFAASALRKTAKGTYVAKPKDTLLRILVLPTVNGLQEIAVRDSRQASLVAEYWDAVQRYLQKGDESALRKFRGKRIKDATGKSISLLTSTEELDHLGHAGELSFESLYARSA